ncbi:sensor histidine kinase [Amycolatopsis solani]|uniref:sensor histidine kinase n=1 Tax=Amycolatopsis solani TaxID=3028615 RepID=UPI0025B1F993|nr:sensor histidine kinase [Amycolatopsis sp. MEP2-6]
MRTVISRSTRATAVLASGLQTALPALAGVLVLPFLVVLLPFAPSVTMPVRALARLERERVGRHLGFPLPEAAHAEGGGRLRAVRDPATWRDLLWLAGHGLGGTFLGLLGIALWPAIVASATVPVYWWLFPPESFTGMLVIIRTWPQALTLPLLQAACYAAMVVWLVPLIARGQLRLARTLLGPNEAELLAQQVERLTETRAEALESHGAELRRIERDLHDGIQAQLVAVSVRLGLAARTLSAEPDHPAARLVQDAQSGIEDSLGNLRSIIRGIYPPILADRGLAGAVHALAGGQRIPVTVRVPDDLPRPPAAIEAAAYFVVAESLTNVTKHSTAEHAEVIVEDDGHTLRVTVRDDGKGGADAESGSGLSGIQRRVAALDGTARIDSPVNTGTTIEVLLPCG